MRSRRRRKRAPVPFGAAPTTRWGLWWHPNPERSLVLRRRLSSLLGREVRAVERQSVVPARGGPILLPLENPATAPSTAGVTSAPAAAASTRRVVSLKNERQCLRCRRWFWAWDTERTICYFCEP